MIREIYEELTTKIDALLVDGKYSKLEDTSFGEAFSYHTNTEILSCANKLGEMPVEIFLSQIERHRNKFIKKHKIASLHLSFVLVQSLLFIGENRSDLRFLNTAMKLLEKIKAKNWCSRKTYQCVDILIELIKGWCLEIINMGLDLNIDQSLIERKFTQRILSEPNKFNIEHVGKINTKVIVFSPNPYSLYTLSVLCLLEKYGIAVEAVFVRRIFNIKRIRQEFARDGKRLIKKVIRKLIFKDRQRTSENSRNLSDVKCELGIKNKSVLDWCKDYSIPLIKCNTINDKNVIERLSIVKPDYGVFTGGGIVCDDVLRSFNVGVLNWHAGILPHYRGMDVIEWPTLLGDKINTGSTVHFMSERVDEGELLYAYRMERSLSVISSRMELESFAPYLQVKSLIDHLLGEITSVPQKQGDGLNYYVMHPWLFKKAVEISNK